MITDHRYDNGPQNGHGPCIADVNPENWPYAACGRPEADHLRTEYVADGSERVDSAELRHVSAALVLAKLWPQGTPGQRENLRLAWPELADALDALTWRPAPEGTSGMPEAPLSAQNRSERATSATASDRARRARGGRGGDLPPGKFERAARQAGDMHEPPEYPRSHLQF